MGPYIAPHNVRDTKVAFQSDIIEPGNWKLTMENNRECYHCAANHPELTVPLFAYGFGYAPEDMDETDRAERRALCLHAPGPARLLGGGRAAVPRGRPPRRHGHRLPHRAPAPRRGGRVAHDRHHGGLPPAPRQPLERQARRPVVLDAAEFLAPLHGRPHRHLLGASRSTPERTLLRTKWLVHKDAVEGVDYDLEKLTEVWLATNAQDSELVSFCQEGARSTGLRAGALFAAYGDARREVLQLVCRPHDRPSRALACWTRTEPGSQEAAARLLAEAQPWDSEHGRRPGLPGRAAGDARRQDLRARAARPAPLRLQAGPVPDLRVRDRRRDDPPLLHDLGRADPAARGLDHRQARAGRPGLELAARQPAGPAAPCRALGPDGRVHLLRPPGRASTCSCRAAAASRR